MRFLSMPFFVVALLSTSGCATQIPWDAGTTQSVQVGMSRSQVESAFGTPTRVFVDPEGYTTLVFLREEGGAAVVRSATELVVRFYEDRVASYSHSATTTTVTPSP
jgi:hypothetical protein